MLAHAYICDGMRTPFGRYGGCLAAIRTDDLAAVPITSLIKRNAGVDWSEVDDVILGNANGAGEDNRNVARMAVLLAGLPESIPGVTVNRLCGSSLQAVGMAAQAIKSGDADVIIAGGVESMTRAPFVIPKGHQAFDRNAEIYDTTIGWRFINERIREQYGVDSMPETAENLAEHFSISRHDQDAYAQRSQERARRAYDNGYLRDEICPINAAQRRGPNVLVDKDEQPRPDTTSEALAGLRPIVKPGGTVTAGNASSINDGAAALLIASQQAVDRFGLTPRARLLGMSVVGVPPRIMGFGPAPASRRLLERLALPIDAMDVIELNEAFAAQVLAVLRDWGLPDDDDKVNPNGGAIAIGHPLGASGARLVLTAINELIRRGGRYGLCTMCIGVGQGIAVVVETV